MAGDMVYYEVRNEFYDSVSGILLVFDVTRQNSFRSLGRWLQELRTEAGNHVSEIAVCVCGNKTDQFPREVTYFEASQWCARRNLPYFETSALTGHGVDEAIHTLLESIVEPNAESTWAQQNGARHWWEIPEKECADTHSNTTSSKSHSTVRSPHNTREVPSSKQKVGHTDSRQKDVNGCTQKEGNIIKRIQNAKTHYEILGLGPQATKDEINRAYRRLAFVIHPDKNTAPGSEEAFKALTAARRALLNSGLP
ncbi:hypothetical protein T265_09444 [Opisthorchis viverrini]|uniref:J domain-containing protein n=1 Tax=Opisthorchis viverrini TaxID=6198 RepID=A0A074Z5Q5_OPIVI|nr:hypothetical protein T265_09444 [Opisthorchis viverrini]KER22466.1 hypothetical protein T265_09444 [Opisthorchis viverrini]